MTVKVLVPISGGKDSQACLKLALEHYPAENIRALFCDTNFEHPLTYIHAIQTMAALYGVQIDIVSGGSVLDKTIKYGRFPGGGARHCTDELKIRETRIYCKALAEKQGCGFEVWYGMRSEESTERAARYQGKVCDELYPPHEVMPKKYPKYLAKMGVMFRLAVLHWSKKEIFAYVGWENVNPLYWDTPERAGFDRVGCFPCMAFGDKAKAKAFNHDAFGHTQFIAVTEIGRQIGKGVWAKGAEESTCMVCSI